MPTAITRPLTTLQEAEKRFGLARTEAENFFPEWQQGLPPLTELDQISLDELRRRYLYQRSTGHLREGMVTLLLASPLLTVAGFYDPPFVVRSEEPVELQLQDSQETLQGRIDLLVLQEQFWVVVLESKKTALSVWAALPQTLAYLMANPQPKRPSFGVMTNGDEIVLVKLTQSNKPQNQAPQYNVSRVFSPIASAKELHLTCQILKSLGTSVAA